MPVVLRPRKRAKREAPLEQPLEALKVALIAFLEEATRCSDAKEAAPMIHRVVEALRGHPQAPAVARSSANRQLGCCRHLSVALSNARAACEAVSALAAAFEAAEPLMRWTQTEWYRKALGDDYVRFYPPRSFPCASFADRGVSFTQMDNYGYTNVLGWKPAVWAHPSMLVAFVLIGPGRHYPQHHHEAEEACRRARLTMRPL